MAIENAKFRGRDFLLKLFDGAEYVTVAGCQSNGATFANESVDITDKQDDTFRKLINGGGRGLSVSASGFVTGADVYDLLRDAVINDDPVQAQIIFGDGLIYWSHFLISSKEIAGEYNGAQTFSASLESSDSPVQLYIAEVPIFDANYASSPSIIPQIGDSTEFTATFTRSSTASYRDEFGGVAYVQNDMPRFTHDDTNKPVGYIGERGFTNKAYPTSFMDAGVGRVVNEVECSLAQFVAAPDGTTSASEFAESATASIGRYITISAATITASVNNTISVFVKRRPGGTRHAGIVVPALSASSGGTEQAGFNLDTGVATIGGGSPVQASMEPWGNGYWRISLTFLAAASPSGALQLRITNDPATGVGSFNGDPDEGLIWWGANVTATDYAHSFVPTTSSEVTKAADYLRYTNFNAIAGWETSQVSLSVDSRPGQLHYASAVSEFLVALSDGTYNERVSLQAAATAVIALINQGGANQATINLGAYVQNTKKTLKLAVASANNNFAASRNGNAPTTDGAGIHPTTMNELSVSVAGSGAGNFFGQPIARVSVWGTRIANADLQAVTGV